LYKESGEGKEEEPTVREIERKNKDLSSLRAHYHPLDSALSEEEPLIREIFE